MIIDSLKKLQKYQLPRMLLAVFLLIILIVGILPDYITGKWSWKNTPQITNLKYLRKIREDGLTISDLPTISHQKVLLAHHKWLLQIVENDTKTVVFLLLTPNGPKDKPQVEWMNINGLYRWKTDSQKRVKFTLKIKGDSNETTDLEKQDSHIEARFFRGWTKKQTYAVMQWYAWPGGGSPEPGDWFWADRLAILSKKRVPWAAVSIMFPIEPLEEIDPYLPQLISIGKKIQASLTTAAFK